MGNMGMARTARTMTWSLDKKHNYSMVRLTCLTMGTRPPSLPVLADQSKPLHLCSVMLRMMSLMAAMHLWELCIDVRGYSWGGERSSLLLFMMLLLVVVDMLVVVIL